MMMALVAATLAAAPMDIVEAYNLLPSAGKIFARDAGGYEVKGAGCAAGASVDLKNMFISIGTKEGPDCEEEAHKDFTAFKKSDGTYVWLLWMDLGIYAASLQAYRFERDGLVPDHETEKSLPQLKDLLPDELWTDKLQTRVYYELPQQGTTVVASVRKKDLLSLCKGAPPAAACAPAAASKLKAVRRAKWNRTTGLFELVKAGP